MEIKLYTKSGKTGWLKLNDTQEIYIDYPTVSQVQEIQNLSANLHSLNEDNFNEKLVYIAKLFIRYTIKDVKGFDGWDTKNILQGGLLNENFWLGITYDTNQALELYSLLKSELEFTETDKKKL